MHDASRRVKSVQATIRIEERKGRRPAVAVPVGATSRGMTPVVENELASQRETVRIWMTAAGDVREERRGGAVSPLTSVRSASRWMVTRGSETISSRDVPDGVSGAGEEFGWLLDPSGLLGALRFEPLGEGNVADRRTVRLRGVPRAVADPERFVWLLRLGGADDYVVDVDAALGVILRVEARVAGRPVLLREVPAISFNETFDAALLQC
jgi:hypothetical protein